MKKIQLLWMLPAILLCSCSKKEKRKDTPVINVVAALPTAGHGMKMPFFVGQAQAETIYSASFTTAGTLLKVHVEEGQSVKKGQLIAEIDPTLMRTALNSSEAVLNQARDAYNRMKFLHDTNSLSEIQWVEAQSKLSQAQAAYDIAKRNLADCRLYSPATGVIGSKLAQSGETVMPGQPVATILDINSVKVAVSIPEKEIAMIKSDTPATVTVEALGGETFSSGKITKSVQSNVLTHTYEASIETANPGHRILPGMVCYVTFQNMETGMITVPVTAIMRGAGNSLYVWVKCNGIAKRVPVEIGSTYGSRVEILSGISENDSVIVKGMQKISEGSKVATL